MYLRQPSRRCHSSEYLESLQKKVLKVRNSMNHAALVFQDTFGTWQGFSPRHCGEKTASGRNYSSQDLNKACALLQGDLTKQNRDECDYFYDEWDDFFPNWIHLKTLSTLQFCFHMKKYQNPIMLTALSFFALVSVSFLYCIYFSCICFICIQI